MQQVNLLLGLALLLPLLLSLSACTPGYSARVGIAWNALQIQVAAESPPGATNAVAGVLR